MLGDVLDYLLHLTPLEAFKQETAGQVPLQAAGSAASEPEKSQDLASHDESLRHALQGRVCDIDECLQPLVGSASFGAYADLIARVHESAGAAATLSALPLDGAAQIKDAPTRPTDGPDSIGLAEAGHGEISHEKLTAPYVIGGGVFFACNLEVLSLMLRDGYAQRAASSAGRSHTKST